MTLQIERSNPSALSAAAKPANAARHLVLLIAYDQLCTFEFGCAVEIFALKRPELNVDWYDFAVHSLDSGPLQAAGGVIVQAPHQPQLMALADTIIIPGWRSTMAEPPAEFLTQLRAAHARGARICSICSGVFVLAAAGLLTGIPVTTHWRYAEELAKRYPELTVQESALYVQSGNIVTAAGSAAGLDMMLHLVRQDFGAAVASQVAQRLVVPLHREGGQAQFIGRPVLPPEKSRLSALLAWVREHLSEPLSVASMAARAAMTPRTLQRAFLASTGLSPLVWLNLQRIAHAKLLLETTRLPHDEVARLSGFGSLAHFRYHFKRSVGITATQHQMQFPQ